MTDFPLMTQEDVILHDHLFAVSAPNITLMTEVDTPTLSTKIDL